MTSFNNTNYWITFDRRPPSRAFRTLWAGLLAAALANAAFGLFHLGSHLLG